EDRADLVVWRLVRAVRRRDRQLRSPGARPQEAVDRLDDTARQRDHDARPALSQRDGPVVPVLLVLVLQRQVVELGDRRVALAPRLPVRLVLAQEAVEHQQLAAHAPTALNTLSAEFGTSSSLSVAAFVENTSNTYEPRSGLRTE